MLLVGSALAILTITSSADTYLDKLWHISEELWTGHVVLSTGHALLDLLRTRQEISLRLRVSVG